MLRALRQPKWLISALVVMALAALFIRLGFWQLDRLEERRSLNVTAAERLGAEPVDLFALLAGSDPPAIEYRRVIVTGRFLPEEEVLIRSQTHLGTAGFHVITPLLDGERAVLVNRGWVHLTMDQTPVGDAPPPDGDVRIEGWVHLTQTKPALGPEDPPGELSVFNRVDLERIQDQVSVDLVPLYVVLTDEEAGELPVPVDLPEFDDAGPHLGYAIQWFAFAVVGLVGFFFLMRREGHQSR
jgi:surfeit locus 1 family protein